jgi:hypothetical protein
MAVSDRRPLDRRLGERTDTMTTQSFTTTLQLHATPSQVYDAINHVRGWWSEEIEGATDRLGAAFEFHYKDLHRSTHEITELVPGKKVVWRTVKSEINFVRDKAEWDGTEVVFDIARRGDQTVLTFTHVGLVPSIQCYGDCTGGWTYHLGSLRELIATGKGYPNRRGEDASYA